MLRRFYRNFKAAKSIQKLAPDLYTLEYRGDYGFDEFLARGGASSDARMAEYIASFLSGGFIKANTADTPKDFGCSTLTLQSPEGDVYMGRNYDWEEEGQSFPAMIVRTFPTKGYASVSTCGLPFLGFGKDWRPEGMPNQYMSLSAIYVPLDGINEKGLCVADLINGDTEETHQNTGKPALTTVSAIRLLLDQAATVEEALELLSRCDMHSSIGTAHHLAITDAKGRAVVVEYVNNEMIVTDTPVVTNHYLSEGEKCGLGNEESHRRFQTLMQIAREAAPQGKPQAESQTKPQAGSQDKLLADSQGNPLADPQGTPHAEPQTNPQISSQLKAALETVSYENITRWSIVYDTRKATAAYYWQGDFSREFSFRAGAFTRHLPQKRS